MANSTEIDPLTGLHNRDYFYQAILSEDNTPYEHIILLFDVDDFSYYNMSFGHLKGDNFLQQAAVILKQHYKDDVLCRYGGQQFAVLCQDEYKATTDAKQVLASVEALQFKHEHPNNGSLTFSCGMTIMKRAASQALKLNALMAHPEAQLKIAKEAGKNLLRQEYTSLSSLALN